MLNNVQSNTFDILLLGKPLISLKLVAETMRTQVNIILPQYGQAV
jgi:hypothetical protein